MTTPISTQPAARPQRLPGDPTLSVVVTCYNYGHFLESCLESLYAQSWPPDQIVVVDDGSTDASGTLLQAHSGRVTVIATPNSGQAAAFNRGFAASTGDIVLFLDADDLLDPVAVETITTCWADDLAALTFGLRTVDGAGRGTGVHSASASADTGDNRPRLLATGTFAFPPTSGNAFSRGFLTAVLPMPEPRWRISADCYLIRAAALFGRFAQVPRALGAYRIHGGNNYALGLSDAADLARRVENRNDVADALWSLAETPGRFTGDPDEAKALAAALRLRARAVLDGLDGADIRAAEGHPARQCGAMTRLASPRWPRHLPFDQWVGADSSVPVPALEDLIVPDITASECSAPACNVVEFTIDPHPDMLALKLHLAQRDCGGGTMPVIVRVNGTPAWQGDIETETHLTVPIRQAHRDMRRHLRIDVEAPGQGRSAVMVLGLGIATRGTEFPAPLLDVAGWRPMDEALGAALDPRDWKIGPTGGATLIGSAGHLRFSVPAGGARDLMLDFAGWPPRGSLIVSENGHMLFVGTIGVQRTILVRLPAAVPPVGKHDLRLHFQPDGSDGAPVPLSIAAIGLMADNWSGTVPDAPLNLGETVHFEAGRDRVQYLLDGWDTSEPSGARNLSAEAMLAFRPPEGAVDMRLVLELATVHEPVPGFRHIVGVSLDGAMIAALALEGAGTIEVPLGDARAGRGMRLGLHSAYLGEATGEPEPQGDDGAQTAGGAPGMTGVLALLELRSVTLLGVAGERAARKPLPRAAPPQQPAAQRLLVRAARILDGDGPDTQAAVLRAEITTFVAACSPAACILFTATPGAVERLARLSARTGHLKSSAGEEAAIAALQARSQTTGAENDTERLRRALVAILHSTAADVPHMADLDQLPPPLLWDIPALAGWLTSVADIKTAAAHGRHVAFLGRLLGNVERILSREPEGSALFRLAALTLKRLRSTRAIFGSGVLRDLIRQRGRAIERLLTLEGARLAAPRLATGATGRLRIGVMVRNVTPSPEGWALLGMYGALDPDRFERVLIRLDMPGNTLGTGDIFAEELCLEGVDVASGVDAIRALELDLFLTGAYAGEWEKAGLILAHRLAPVQIWPGAVCPTTGGFRSFDRVLSARATEPDDPQRHYMQPLAWIDGPLQAAYAFPAPARTGTASLRQALSLKRGRVMLTSGAMAHKVTDTLLSAWAEILANAPGADLVLYPFAPNWAIAFAEDRFRARIDRHLAKAGVAPDRVRLLATQTTEGVSAIVRAADLYLDSFPYTGATTVCEALSCVTPALTLAGDSLRELTGTSWVRAFGLPELVAETPADYVARATALATDASALKALRGKLKARLAAGPPPHHHAKAFGAAFSDALWRIAEASGKFPELSSKPAWDMAAIDGITRPAPRSPAIVLRLTPPASRLVVLTSPRSGSSLFCHMLNATPEICCHYELFHDEMIEFFGQTVLDKAAIAGRDADPVGFLERTFTKGFDAGYRLVGFKHMGFFSKAVSDTVTADPAVRIVILRRNNLMAKFSSLGIAGQTRQWKVATGQKVHRPKVRFDPERFARFERWENGLNRARNDLLARHRRNALFLEYTDLRTPETGRRLSEFLGFGLHWDGEVGVQRLNPGRILDRFSNPAAVRAFLARRGVPEWAEGG